MARAMLSKSLIQFSVDGQGSVTSLLFGLRPNYGGGDEDNGDLLQEVSHVPCRTQCPQPCSSPPPTHGSARDSWTLTGKSGSVSGGVIPPFSWVLVHTRFCLCPPRVCFPSPVEVVLSSSTGPQIFSGFSVSLLDPQVGKSFVGLGTFATV